MVIMSKKDSESVKYRLYRLYRLYGLYGHNVQKNSYFEKNVIII